MRRSRRWRALRTCNGIAVSDWCVTQGWRHFVGRRRRCIAVYVGQAWLWGRAGRLSDLLSDALACLATLRHIRGMILGLGNDVIDIRRVEASLERFGDRFILRIFTDVERARSERRTTGRHNPRAASYAKRFAAKEACAKALGTGLRRGVFWRDMGVINLPSGQPTLRLTGGALARLQAMTPAGFSPVIHLTMTDDYPMAEAVVVLSAVPNL
jgi:holo-[acyl-carrier protein] synthase